MNIFVGSLPFKLKEVELKALFEEFGQVRSVKIVIDKITRQNKGFGFIEMESEQEAYTAIRALDGKEVMGRVLSVSISEEKIEAVKKSKKPEKEARKENAIGDNESITWRKNFFRKKKKESPIVYGDPKKEDRLKGNAGRKKAKNFKVGARKKK